MILPRWVVAFALLASGALCSNCLLVPGFGGYEVGQGGGSQNAGAGAGTSTSHGTAQGPAGTGGSPASSGPGSTSTGAGAASASTGAGAGSASSTGTGGGDPHPFLVGQSFFHDSAGGSDNEGPIFTDAKFTKPAGTKAGDLILVFIMCDHHLENLGGYDLGLLGWTLWDQHEEYGQDGQGLYIIYRFAGASEPSTYVFAGINPNAPSYGDATQGLLRVYRNVNPAQPFDGYMTYLDNNGSSASVNVTTPTPTITTTTPNCLALAGLGPDTSVDAPIVTSWPVGFTDDQTSVMNPSNPYPDGWTNFYIADQKLGPPTTVPAESFGWKITYGGTQYYGALSFVLALSPP